MECSSEDNIKVDLEVENTLSKSESKVNYLNEHPLSPILGECSKVNRHFLLQKKLLHKRSRVKLSDRFEESIEKNNCSINIKEVTNADLSLTEDDSSVSRLEKLEELENRKQKFYKLLVNGDENSEFCFKVPTSPAPNSAKKNKQAAVSKNEDCNENIENEHEDNKLTLTQKDVLPKCSGFQTAKGRVIEVSEAKIKKYSKLFEDIMNPLSASDTQRNAKLTFLNKSKFNSLEKKEDVDNKKSTLAENDVNESTSHQKMKKDTFEGNILLEKFKMESGNKSNLEEEILKNTRDVFNNKQFGNIDEKILQNNIVEAVENRSASVSKNKVVRENDISLTQQFSESGITNTQMISAMDKALNMIESNQVEKKISEGFKGFKKAEISSSRSYLQHLIVNYKRFYAIKKDKKKSSFLLNTVINNKHYLEDLPLPPKKRIKSEEYLKSEGSIVTKNHPLSNISLGGFSSASGKSIKVSSNSMNRAKCIFDNVCSNLSNNLEENNSDVLHEEKKKASKNFNTLERKKLPLENITTLPKMMLGGFSKASGKSVQVSDSSLKKAKNIFDSVCSSNVATDKSNDCLQSCFNQAKDFKSDKETIQTYLNRKSLETNLNDETNFLPLKENEKKSSSFDIPKSNLKGFSSASGKAVQISDKSLKRAKSIFGEIDTNFSDETKITAELGDGTDEPKFSKCLSKFIENFKTAQNRRRERKENEGLKVSKMEFDEHNELEISNIKNLSELAQKPSTSFSNSLNVNEHSLRTVDESFGRNENSFESDEPYSRPAKRTKTDLCTPTRNSIILNKSEGSSSSLKNSKKRLGISSCKQIQIPKSNLEKAKWLFDKDVSDISPIKPVINTYTSTPIKQNSYSTPVKGTNPIPSKNFSSFVDSAAITPIKIDFKEDDASDFSVISSNTTLLHSPTRGGAVEQLKELKLKQEFLEDRLRILVERQRALEDLREEKSSDYKRPRKGVLFQLKCSKSRMPLASIDSKENVGDDVTNRDLLHISPKNAENLHLKVENFGVITTSDGAVIIPNSNDLVGLSEVENAFKAMPGVEPGLLPNGWIRNHYKWIVWKLASYERMFPLQFKGSLNVEYIIQQLKYRYDREIDRAERPALRKIFEKDDAPQKRMVLCVSNIKTIDTNKYELQLTDGWYGIRTVIDEPLCIQVKNGKIKIGTKLIVASAELSNCDGCYPLEATDLTFLRINFNATRRALWHTKLGYQRNPNPFPVQIQGVHPQGGPIGAIQIFIARKYPLKYFDRSEGATVWRNKRAEDVSAQRWESDRSKRLERIQDEVSKSFDTSREKENVSFGKRQGVINISGITCPKQLFETLENSADPEHLEQILSHSQRNAVLDYKAHLSMKKQHELSVKIEEDMKELKLAKRDVSPLLKLLVIDINGDCDKAYNFIVWRPSETHMQTLREGTCFTVHNVLPKISGDLNAYSKTTFKSEPLNQTLCNKFKRRFVGISELGFPDPCLRFNEFDTVGFVVETKVDAKQQQAWLADHLGRLLLIKVYEGPSTCLLLDNLKRGHSMTVCNLSYCGLKDDVAQASANHFTVFSCYSQYRHLQEGLENFKKELPKSMESLLKKCDAGIKLFRENHSGNSSATLDGDESTLVSSRITSTDNNC